ncbi:MAG: 4Fe-4S binding protein [Pseudomonadota bacterium]|nr:4Fe-4S binding protein [Pseudomonadota bacterium]
MNTISIQNLRARQEAQIALEKLKVQPTSLLEYQSSGRVAVIGGEEAIELAPRLSGALHPQVILTGGVEEPGVPLVSVGGRSLVIEGYLGNFTIHLGEVGKSNRENIKVDLIWDLGSEPLLDTPMKPPGYICSDDSEENVQLAVEALSELVGTFQKPKYFNYDASICAHARSGITACTRCIDACPAQAITSLEEAIEVDPYLCQGGGVCTTVCPGGALTYAYPSMQDTLDQVRKLLHVYKESGGEHPVLAFFAENELSDEGRTEAGERDEVTRQIADNVLPMVVEELASTGLEVWLSALAYGAGRIVLVDRGSMVECVRTALQQQIAIAQEILQGMGYPEDAIQLQSLGSVQQQAGIVMPVIETAAFAAAGGKRQTLFMAIDHLYTQSSHKRPLINLAAGAPFGTAAIDAERCTLCLSCVSACPGKALQSGHDAPQIHFIEGDCLQCGICTRTCPEDAIWISPRLLFDRERRSTAQLLYEEEPFCCVSCGKPFASRSMIENMQKKLVQHPMFQSERARERLLMCEECRVVDVVQDADAMGADMESRQH